MFEYKVIPAPVRAEKVRGLKTTAERFAHVLTQAINAEADEGWDYVRAETLPCEERKGIFGGTRSSTETVLIFRRALPGEDEAAPAAADDDAPGAPAARPQLAPAPERREPLFRPDALSRAAAARRAEPRLRAHDGER
jgi:hypothetical protein